MNGFNINTTGIPNVCTALWNLQHIKDLKMTEWSVETCSPIISSNKCCADVNNWLIKRRRVLIHADIRRPLTKHRRSRQHQPPKDCVKVLRPRMVRTSSNEGVHNSPRPCNSVPPVRSSRKTRFCRTQHAVVTPNDSAGRDIIVISRNPFIRTLVIRLANYPEQLGPSGKFVENSTKLRGRVKWKP